MNYSCFGPLLTTAGSRNSCPPETSLSKSPLTNGVRQRPRLPFISNSKSSDTLFGGQEHGDYASSDHYRRVPLGSFTSDSQPAKLEVIQDLDLYFIRQIAHSLQEFDLEQKIDLEIKMREGTTKLLAACKHPSQSLEAAKSLITSNERMTAYMAELQRRKVQERKTSLNNSTQVRVETSKAKVAVSDIRMPLIWKDTDHFKNKGDYRRFSVFCLLKIGTEIYDTLMVENVDRSLTDITFDDVVLFQQIPPKFEFRLEVYSHVLQNDLSIASTPRKIKKKISSSVSRTIGRKLAASLKEELNTIDIGPKFDLVAHATLRLSDAGDDIKTHDLILENLENPHNQLPLFGHFCCRLAAQPDCVTTDRYAGYLGLIETFNNVSGCRRMWCTLRNSQLSFWAKADDSHTLPPILTIIISKAIQIQTEVPITNYRLCFVLSVPTSVDRRQDHYLSADSDTDYYRWIAHIRQHVDDFEQWGPAATDLMEIPSPAPLRAQSFLYQRQGSTSLYDATPVIGIRESPSQTSILQENNRFSPPPSLRSRSSSTSSAASSVSSSTKQNFSFFRFRKSAKDSAFY